MTSRAPGARSKRAAVIGGGVGGLSAAAILARNGIATTLFERNAIVGGKLAEWTKDGFTWDAGPSLLTLPQILRETWALAGEPFDLDLIQLPVTCRYHWADGFIIDEDQSFWNRPDVARFLKYAAGLWEISEHNFLRSDVADWRSWFKKRNLEVIQHLPKLASPSTLAQVVERCFSDERVRQIFLRFATYNGSSPYQTPSAFNIIPYVEAKFGGWYVKGGMRRIADGLAKLCAKNGVELRTGAEVTSVQQRATDSGGCWQIGSHDGSTTQVDGVICNQDVITAHETLLAQGFRDRFRHTHLTKIPISSSAFLMFLGVAGTSNRLLHHNILFSDDYPLEFVELFDKQAPQTNPTIYIAISAKTEPERAPADCENWFVLVNAPSLNERTNWKEFATAYGNMIIARLEKQFGFENLSERLIVRRDFTPEEFAARDLAHAGSLYGFASHGLMTAFRRPPISPRGMSHLHFAGGTTHPGGGVPLAMLSGRIAAAKMLEELT